MITWLIKSTNEFRVETMSDVEEFHQKLQDKAADGGFTLTSFSWAEKFVKEKGEVVDSYFSVKCTFQFNELKEPEKPFTDVDYKAVLVDEPSSNGKAVITERLTFDIHAFSKNNPFWELWRDLPESYIDGVKVDYKVNSVKQILADGSEIIYKESPKLYWEDSDYTDSTGRYGPRKWYHSEGPYNESAERYECVFFYVEPLYRGDVVFEIEYEMNNAALRYRDCSELYISLYSEETIKHLESYKAQILVPDKDMPSTGNYAAYTYGTSANRFPFTESDTINPGYHTFSFELDKNQLKFNPNFL